MATVIPDNELVTVKAAAERLGVKRSKLDYAIRAFKLEHQRKFTDGRGHYFRLYDLKIALDSVRQYSH